MLAKRVLYLTFMATAGLLAGCAHHHAPNVSIPSPDALTTVRTVAVAPFENLSEDVTAGGHVTNLFLVHYFNSNLTAVTDPGNVDSFLLRSRIRSFTELDTDTIRNLGAAVGAQAVVLGGVHEFGFRSGVNATIPVVGVSIRILDTRSGKIIFAASHAREGDDEETVFGFGRVESLTRLADETIRELVAVTAEWARKSNLQPMDINSPDSTQPLPVYGEQEAGESGERRRVRDAARSAWEKLK